MSKKLPIYFSDDAWSSLQELMGPEGKPSPTINTVLEQIAVQNELVAQLGLTAVLPKSKVSIPVSLERIPAGPAFSTKDEQDKALDLNEFLIHNPIWGLGSNGTKNQRKPYQRFSVSSSQAPISTKQLRMSASWLISVSRSCTLLSSSSSLRYGMVNS